ncbi:hypothetical protein D5S17_09975 [Pseudonocardiaceae bacterium YIM PH 21723]|nr:hypothetical protein D5S17_09975 [Pseudonocardiaceae bacterium YIM PH 21723]
MADIGILGAGISGLQLALRLQQLGLTPTLYTPQDSEQLAAGGPRNFPVRFGPTVQRERELGVFEWDMPSAQVAVWAANIFPPGQDPLYLSTRLDPPANGVDFRVYLPTLLARFAERGGKVIITEDLPSGHDLLVVANGSRSFGDLFPRDPQRSPYTAPQRRLCAGYYHGVVEGVPNASMLNAVPGVGELIHLPFHGPTGKSHTLAVEAVPGGPLEVLTRFDVADDPSGFLRLYLKLIAHYAPELRERITTADFELIAPGELLQGGLTPVVRRGWATLPDGGQALAIGDAWITNDPLTGQGANLGSHQAFAVAEAIVAGQLDARRISEQLWPHARSVVEWTNTYLGPMPRHIGQVFEAAAGDQHIADALLNKFHDPVAMWRTLRTADSVDEFLAGFRV